MGGPPLVLFAHHRFGMFRTKVLDRGGNSSLLKPVLLIARITQIFSNSQDVTPLFGDLFEGFLFEVGQQLVWSIQVAIDSHCLPHTGPKVSSVIFCNCVVFRREFEGNQINRRIGNFFIMGNGDQYQVYFLPRNSAFFSCVKLFANISE